MLRNQLLRAALAKRVVPGVQAIPMLSKYSFWPKIYFFIL